MNLGSEQPKMFGELNIKQRLDDLKKLFEEDEENEQVRKIQEHWEQQQKVDYLDEFKPKSLFR